MPVHGGAGNGFPISPPEELSSHTADMKHALLFTFAFSLSGLAGDHSPADAAASFALAEPDLEIGLVAAEPQIESPCAMAFDERGRLFVAENRGYPNSATPVGRVAMLEDSDGDGHMDRRTTFADGLTFPNGVMPWRGGVIVTCAPDVFFLKDTDGDGVADEKKVLLTGFATTGSTQLRVNAPTLGVDGWIYFAAGLSGGEITAPGRAEPAVKMTGDLRWHPESGAIENVDGRSQYGMSFDDFGRRFICMNRVQVQHVVLDSRWLRRNPALTFSETVQNCPELIANQLMHSTGGAARLFPISANITTADSHQGFFSAACGVTIWRDAGLPARFRGHAFSCDPTANVVHLDRLVQTGASFSAQPFYSGREFLASRDDWFRPVFLCSGPDGGLYVADMTRKTIEHPDYLPGEVRKRTDFESGKGLGRIWRVKQKGGGVPASAFGTDTAGLVAAAQSDSAWRRTTAVRLLDGRTDATDALLASAETAQPAAMASVLGALVPRNAVDGAVLNRAWNSGDLNVRELVLRVWLQNPDARAWKPDPSVLAQEPAANVRFVAALVLGELDEGGPALGVIAAKDAADRWTRAAVLSSIGKKKSEFLESFAVEAKSMGSDENEILTAVGRSYPNLGELFSQDRLSASRDFLAPIILGAAQRSGERLDPETKMPKLAAVLRETAGIALDASRPTSARLVSMRLLGQMPWASAGALAKLVVDANDDVRTEATRLLAGFPESDAPRVLLPDGAWNGMSPARRELVLGALLGNHAHFSGLLDAVESGRLPANAFHQQRRALFQKHSAERIRSRAAALFTVQTSAARKKAVEESKAALALDGNSTKGREIFRNLCATCHRLEREGHAVGPDLFDIRGQTKENILFHIVEPDAEIAPVFANYIAELKDGRSISGILASETATSITLRGPLAQETALLRRDIEKLEALPNSLMPAGLEQAASKQDLADLLAYLKGEPGR